MATDKTNAREKILKAAFASFLDGPYTRVSMREVAARSGYSHTYVHQIFGGKHELFSAVCQEASEQFMSSLNLLPTDNLQIAVLKLLSVDPLNAPFVRLIRKSAGDADMLPALLSHVGHEDNSSPALANFIEKILTKDFQCCGLTGVSQSAMLVMGCCLIWSMPAATLLNQVIPKELGLEGSIRAAPQELMLAFVSACK